MASSYYNPTNGATQIRVGGYGGQGIILTGMLLGKAASLYDGKEVVFTQSYGPEARGGACNADVIISDDAIDYPLVMEPDILIVMFQEAYVRFRPMLKPGGTLIIDTDLVHPNEDDAHEAATIPATSFATELGRRMAANVVIFGFTVGRTGVVSRDAAERAIEATLKPKVIEMNLRAFNMGFEFAAQEVAAV